MPIPKNCPNGLGEGADFSHPDDLYIRLVMNLAYGEKKELEDASPKKLSCSLNPACTCPKRSLTSNAGRKLLATCGPVW